MDDFEVFCRQAYISPPTLTNNTTCNGKGEKLKGKKATNRSINTVVICEQHSPHHSPPSSASPPISNSPPSFPSPSNKGGKVHFKNAKNHDIEVDSSESTFQVVQPSERIYPQDDAVPSTSTAEFPKQRRLPSSVEEEDEDDLEAESEKAKNEEDQNKTEDAEDRLTALRSRARSPGILQSSDDGISALCTSPRPRMSRALRRGSVPDGLLGLGGGGLGSLDPSRASSGDMDAMYRVRNFSRGRKGVVNHGDTYRSCRSGAERQLPESRSPGGPGLGLGRRRHSELVGVETLNHLLPMYEQALAASRADSEPSALASIGEPDLDMYTVAILGAPGVGKTTLAKQFTTSEDLSTQDSEESDEEEEENNDGANV